MLINIIVKIFEQTIYGQMLADASILQELTGAHDGLFCPPQHWISLRAQRLGSSLRKKHVWVRWSGVYKLLAVYIDVFNSNDA